MSKGAGAIIFAKSTGRFLFGLRSMYCPEPHTWNGIGGSIDKGETAEQATRREIAEEVGYSGDMELVEMYVYRSPHAHYTNFLAIVEDEFTPKLNWEHDDAKWFPIQGFPEPLHPGMALCLANGKTKNVIEYHLKPTELTEGPLPETVPGAPDPALMTFEEYRRLVDPKLKYHPDSAYDSDIEDLNAYGSIKDYETLVQRLRKNNLEFVVRMQTEPCQYAKKNKDGNIIYENGSAIYYNAEECRLLGLPANMYSFAIFNDQNLRVAAVEDEWGCVLIRVAKEYRGFGFGPYLTKIARTVDPAKESGGFTPSGLKNFKKVHQLFVIDALKSGRYRKLLGFREITLDRINEIINSAGLSKRKMVQDKNLSSNDPKDWVLYGDDYGCFILYDKKLKTLFEEEEQWPYFLEKMVKGMIHVSAGSQYGIMVNYGGDTPQIKSFLLRVAASYCAREGATFLVDQEDVDDVDRRYMSVDEKSLASGYWRHEVESIDGNIDYFPFLANEENFRQFDTYQEFRYRLLEFAESKYKINHSIETTSRY